MKRKKLLWGREFRRVKDARTLPFVEITWLDAVSNHGWGNIDDIRKYDPLECKTTGRLVRNDRVAVSVVQTISSEGRGAETWTIPRALVRGKIRVFQ